MTTCLVAVVLLTFGVTLLVLVGVALMVPAATEASERIRLQRETQDAAWEIHSRATDAFGEMLHAARAEDASDRAKHGGDRS